MASEIDNKRLSIELLLEAIYRKYGHDFRHYALASITRRIDSLIEELNVSSIAELQHLVIYKPKIFEKLFLKFAIRVTSMFRDPLFFSSIKKNVFPAFNKVSSLKIWHAGAASGEETYSMAISLLEHKLLEKTQLYSTDFNNLDLIQGKKGVLEKKHQKLYESNYIESGGNLDFMSFFTQEKDAFIFHKHIRNRILFANHNLIIDQAFGEMNMIICRNVLIYFSRELQDRVIELFKKSLILGGYLCLGSKESLQFSSHFKHFDSIDDNWKIYQYVR